MFISNRNSEFNQPTDMVQENFQFWPIVEIQYNSETYMVVFKTNDSDVLRTFLAGAIDSLKDFQEQPDCTIKEVYVITTDPSNPKGSSEMRLITEVLITPKMVRNPNNDEHCSRVYVQKNGELFNGSYDVSGVDRDNCTSVFKLLP